MLVTILKVREKVNYTVVTFENTVLSKTAATKYFSMQSLFLLLRDGAFCRLTVALSNFILAREGALGL